MRVLTIGAAVSLNATASQTPVNLQSSTVKPPIYLSSIQQNVTCTSATPMVATGTVALLNGTAVILGGTAVPTGFTAGTVYYVVNTSGLTFQLAATVGGAAIASSSTGTAVTAYSPSAQLGAGAAAPSTSPAVDDEANVPDSPFLVGDPATVSLQSGAAAGTTTIFVEGADDTMNPPGTPGAYSTLASIVGISVPTILVKIAALPQYIRTRVVNGGADATVANAYLLGD